MFVNLKRRVRTAPVDAPSGGVAATLDDPRLGAVSAALARLRPQIVPDPDAPHAGDDYLADTAYAAPVPPEAVAPATPDAAAPRMSRWAAALADALVAEPRANATVHAGTTDAPDKTAEVAETIEALDAVPVTADINELTEGAFLGGAIPASESDAKLDAFFADVDAPAGGVATLIAPHEYELDGTLLPRAPLHRSRMPDRITNAFGRRKKRRHRKK